MLQHHRCSHVSCNISHRRLYRWSPTSLVFHRIQRAVETNSVHDLIRLIKVFKFFNQIESICLWSTQGVFCSWCFSALCQHFFPPPLIWVKESAKTDQEIWIWRWKKLLFSPPKDYFFQATELAWCLGPTSGIWPSCDRWGWKVRMS